MWNWIRFIASFLVALTIVISILVLYKANEPFAKAKESAEHIVLQSGQLSSIQQVDTYLGKTEQVTIRGLTDKGEEKAVFVEAGSANKGKYKDVLLSKGISSKQAKKIVEQEFTVKKYLHTTLGWEEIGPVWEVAFMDDKQKLSYVYVSFETGQWWKRILHL